MHERYQHVDTAAVLEPKQGDFPCGDVFWCGRTLNATTIVLADGIGSSTSAHIAAQMCVSRFRELLRLGTGFHAAFGKVASSMDLVREPGKPYAAFTALRVRSDGSAVILGYETPRPLLIGAQSAMELPQRPLVVGTRVAYESVCCLESRESVLIASDGITQAGLGDGLVDGWGIGGVRQTVTRALRERVNHLDLPRLVVREAAKLCRNYHDDSSVIVAQLRPGRVVAVLTGPPTDRSNDSAVVNRFMDLPGAKVVCGGTTAEIAARETGEMVEMEEASASLIAPPRSKINGIDLVCEGAITLNQVYNVIEADPKELQEDSGTRDLHTLLRAADRIHFLVGGGQNNAHGDILFKQRGVLERGRIVKLLVQKLEEQGKLVVLEEM